MNRQTKGLELAGKMFTASVEGEDILVKTPRVSLTKAEAYDLALWLMSEVLNLPLNSGAVKVVQQFPAQQLEIPLKNKPDELAERRVSRMPSGVTTFDISDKIPKGEVVKFTVPKKD